MNTYLVIHIENGIPETVMYDEVEALDIEAAIQIVIEKYSSPMSSFPGEIIQVIKI